MTEFRDHSKTLTQKEHACRDLGNRDAQGPFTTKEYCLLNTKHKRLYRKRYN